MFFNSAALVAAVLFQTTQAHMFLASPTPLSDDHIKMPLEPGEFPCHSVRLPTSGGQSMAAGSTQVLAWNLENGTNTAVHGGGSCQISITYEKDPELVKKPSSWKVIYSSEGGCPSNTHLNLDEQYQGPNGKYSGSLPCSDPRTNGVDCVNIFDFTIPKGMNNGHAILGWTWYNTIGDREIYMDCASVNLSGGDGSEMNDLPSMFVANMPGINNCPTTEGVNVKFPYPGKYVTTKTPSGLAAHTAPTYPLSLPVGILCSGDGAPVAGNGTVVAQTASSYAQALPSPPVPGGSVPASQPVTASSSAVGLSSLVTVSNAAPPSSAPSIPSASSQGQLIPAASGSPGSSTCTTGIPCSTPGFMCIGNNEYGLCNIDNCVVPQALAAGTTCHNNKITKRSHIRHA